MGRMIGSFVAVFFFIALLITTWQMLSGADRWRARKVLWFSLVCSGLATAFVAAIITIF